jgi:beta-lysine 5,6-aminomutase beta subunit
MKGFAGDYGLERYHWIDAQNLGAQVLNDELLRLAIEKNADAILVSKVVTQHNIHVKDLKELMIRAEKMGLRDKLIFVAGGPRVTHPLALECGFDAGFGVGTKPSDVASYIVEEFLKRRNALSSVARSSQKTATKPKNQVRSKKTPPKKSSSKKR